MVWSYVVSAGCKNRSSPNGFIFLEILMAAVITAGLMMAVIPAGIHSIHAYERCKREEALGLQGMALEDNVYTSLRYAHHIQLTDSSVRFINAEGLASGFIVYEGVLYKIMNDGTKQPLTGNGVDKTANTDIAVEGIDGQPCFSYREGVIYVMVSLVDKDLGKAWPCRLIVRSLNEADDEA